MRLAPLSAVAALVILVPLGLLANRQLARSLHGQTDSRLETVARRYAALAQVVAAGRSLTAADVASDSALRTTLRGIFATGSVSEIAVELADSAGHALVASPGASGGDLQAFASAVKSGADSAFTFATTRGAERGALAPANLGRWMVLAHETTADADATYHQLRTTLEVIAALLFLVMVGIGFAVDRLVNERIRRPAMELAALAEAVADGNLTVRVNPVESTDEIERLSRALGTMVAELRRLARALNESAGETSTMSGQITASTEQMSASAAQIAQTASDLSGQSTLMAESIQALADSAGNLAPMAERINAGAHEGVARNARLRELALENRRMLDDSTTALDALAGDVEATAGAVRALVDASQEIRTFVSLVQSLARNSKLLALNAAMEAARAGDHGEGFSVVAAEVRRLSAMSSEAAERTQRVVADVMAGVARSSENMERMASTAREVRRTTEKGSASFTQIEASVAELESWTASIETAATSTNALVGEMTERLDAIARGTEAFAAAMEQVAAGSEEQSASTQEIAAAAGAMAHAAERLASLVANLRIGDARPSGGAARISGAMGRVSGRTYRISGATGTGLLR
jgi:methyl-accepting chemotaxis protein